jgi:hypothetical protein
MSIDHTANGCVYFKYDYNQKYSEVQFKFLDAVASMNPANISVCFFKFPYSRKQEPQCIQFLKLLFFLL